MKPNCLFIAVIAIFFHTMTFAQDDAPTLTGTVNISITQGTMACDFILKNMPHINNNYVIRINSGMNIHYFKDEGNDYKISYDTDNTDTLSSGESIAYFFHDNTNKGRFLPHELEIKYVGMYPIADSLAGYQVQDWRGNVAFNGYSVRADGLQSAWYPMLFDTKLQKLYNDVKYDITVNCADCTTLYVNGNKPIKGTTAHFVTNAPQPITMYCGKYDVASIGGTYLLNPDMNTEQQKQFAATINGFKKYYESNLKIPYKEDITFIETTPTAPPDHAFLFVSYPTILNIGVREYGLNSMFDKKRGDYYKPYLAHELGHYYFGTYLRINTEFGDLIDEGFTEYLSFKATKALLPDSIYKGIINKKLKALKDFKGVPIASIKRSADYNNRELYVYYYVPVVLTAIEKEIGEKKMWIWLRTMLNTKTDFTDYAFFDKAFDTAVPDNTENERIKDRYFRSPDALSNAIQTIEAK